MRQVFFDASRQLWILACILVFNAASEGTDFYHSEVIGSGESYDLIRVYDTPPDTTVIDFYGYSDEIFTNDSSIVNIYSGGQIALPVGDNYSAFHNSSTVNVYTGGVICGGSFGVITLYDFSVLNVNGGTIGTFTSAVNSSTVKVDGGSMFSLGLGDYATLNFYKGTIDTFLENYIIPSTATVNIYGNNFSYNPQGRWEPIGDGHWVSKLTGTSFDGGSITYYGLPDPAANSNIHLIPEPATLLLFCFGGLFLRKRRA